MSSEKKKEKQRRVGRRALMKWSLAAGAAFGLPQWKVFEVLEMTGGKALADDAACATCNRSVHIVAGRGGFAWFQLLWPHNDVAAARDSSFAWHAIGEERMAEDTHKPLTIGPHTPWQSLPGGRQVTCLMGGTNETHTRTPSTTARVAMDNGLYATCAAIQTASPTVVPVIAVDDAPYRSAEGAPRVARVGSAGDIVSLFNAAASRAGGLLSDPANAELYSNAYSAFLSLRAAAGRETMRNGHAAATRSAQLLGQNLADRLQPTDEDFARYGIDGGSRSQNRRLARGLIVTAKAFSMGLTSCVILPAFGDDPHGAFADMSNLTNTVSTLQRTLDAFLGDLDAVEDPTCGGSTIGDNTVISINGDTPKNPLQRSNWPDGTPGNANWTYVLGAGHLKTGWFGGIDRSGNVSGYNPTTGENTGASSASTAESTAAAVAYSVARGDMRRVNDFYNGADIRGLVSDETV
jgi:hypothetical protein